MVMGGGAGPGSVLVLGGGPDREREVSLWSAKGVADALREAGLEIHERTIERVTASELAGMPGDVIFPVLHGSYGEGGALQDLLEASGRAYVGCRPAAARLAMDKMGTKLAAARAGVPTAPAAVLNVADDRCPIPFRTDVGRGVVLKPIHDGSSVGVRLVRREEDWAAALASVRTEVTASPGRAYMVESLVAPASESAGARTRELTVGMFGAEGELRPLPVIEIRPATEFYDYEAKYLRDDTRYEVVADGDPVVGVVQAMAVKVARAGGVRHLCRVDFLDPGAGRTPQMLEVNTMPGFTGHSLLPMAAGRAGMAMPDFCRRVVTMAWGERARA